MSSPHLSAIFDEKIHHRSVRFVEVHVLVHRHIWQGRCQMFDVLRILPFLHPNIGSRLIERFAEVFELGVRIGDLSQPLKDCLDA